MLADQIAAKSGQAPDNVSDKQILWHIHAAILNKLTGARLHREEIAGQCFEEPRDDVASHLQKGGLAA